MFSRFGYRFWLRLGGDQAIPRDTGFVGGLSRTYPETLGMFYLAFV